MTLPPVALGLFYLGMIATVMSTIDAYAFIGATTVGRDVIWRLKGGDVSRIPAWSRWGLWITCAFAAALALARPSVVALWHDLGSVVTPVLLLPVLLALSRRGRPGPRGVLWLMVLPAWSRSAGCCGRACPRRRASIRSRSNPSTQGSPARCSSGARSVYPERSPRHEIAAGPAGLDAAARPLLARAPRPRPTRSPAWCSSRSWK
jgi:hypothetical protein